MIKYSKYSLLLLFAFTFQLVSAQNTEAKLTSEKQGDPIVKTEEICNDNGELHFKYDYYVSGYDCEKEKDIIVYHGDQEIYHENGVLRERMYYNNGILEGKYESFFENGNKELVCNFEDGVLNGNFYVWYNDGTPHSEGPYVNNKRTGIWKAWDMDGNLTMERDLDANINDVIAEEGHSSNERHGE